MVKSWNIILDWVWSNANTLSGDSQQDLSRFLLPFLSLLRLEYRAKNSFKIGVERGSFFWNITTEGKLENYFVTSCKTETVKMIRVCF